SYWLRLLAAEVFFALGFHLDLELVGAAFFGSGSPARRAPKASAFEVPFLEAASSARRAFSIIAFSCSQALGSASGSGTAAADAALSATPSGSAGSAPAESLAP